MHHKRYVPRRAFAAIVSIVICISFSLGAVAAVSMKDTSEVEWIDRLALPGAYEDQLIGFYDTLAEACDNDEQNDFLIDDINFGADNDTTDNIEISENSVSIVALSLTLNLSGEDEANSVFNLYMPYVAAVYAAFDRDHPEIFWLSGSTSYGGAYTGPSNGGAGEYTIDILFHLKKTENNYDLRYSEYATESALAPAIQARDARINAILQGAQSEGHYTAYDKIRYFNSVLTGTNEYNTNISTMTDHSLESYCALIGNYGTSGPVCEGYARAMKVLCDAADIPCVLVNGDAISGGSSEPHMWNYVQIEDAWYAVDTTWNDPVGGASGALSGAEHEDWLLVGADTDIHGMPFIQSHPVSNIVINGIAGFVNGPELSNTKYTPPAKTSNFEYISSYLESVESAEFDYGDTITVKVRIVNSDGLAASDQSLELTYGTTVISRSSSAQSGEYTLMYDTSDKLVPTGERVTLGLRFVGDENMPAVSASFSVSIEPTQTEIYFKYEDAINTVSFTYTGNYADIPLPQLDFSCSEELDCNIVYFYRSISDIDGEYTRGLPKDAGEYTVIARAIPYSGDFYSYAESSNSITVSIEKRDITVRADDKTKAQGEQDPKLTYSVDASTPLPDGEHLLGSLSRRSGEDVGQYDILQNTLTNEKNPNYNITFVGGTLTITEKTVVDTNNSDTESSDSSDTSDTLGSDSGEPYIGGKQDTDVDHSALDTVILAAGISGVAAIGVFVAVLIRKNKK